jgi:putative tryptophan/tyrosine transport system substrate-binding protein
MQFDQIERREFITLLGGAMASWPLSGHAQQAMTHVPRIGWLVTGSPASYRFSLDAFRDGLKALSYLEGRNISIEYRWANGNVALLPELAKTLVEQKVEIIIAGGSTGAEAAKRATSVIPIVAAGVGDLVELGLVTSLARPGGNLTGFVANAPETAAKRLQIMKEIKPAATRAAVLWNSASSIAKLEWGFANEFAAANGLVVRLYDSRFEIEELKNSLVNVRQSNPDLLIVLNDPFMFTHRKVVVEAANQMHVPAVYGFREFVDDGGLISYGVSIADTYRRAAQYVDKILRGAKPADLPVELPIKIDLASWSVTARHLDNGRA